MRRIRALALVLVALPCAAGVQEEACWDAALRDSRNEVVSLARWRGRPTVLFYEDQGSMDQNIPLKRELIARARAHHLVGRANVLGVANLQGLDFFPARLFALSAIRDAEQKERVPVLVDWNRTLASPPWNLPSKASSVVVLDAHGRWVHSWSGPLDARDIDDFFRTLSRLLDVDIPPAS